MIFGAAWLILPFRVGMLTALPPQFPSISDQTWSERS